MKTSIQKTPNRCGSCFYHAPCPVWHEGVCINPMSTYYDYYTDDDAYCKEFEPEKPENDIQEV